MILKGIGASHGVSIGKVKWLKSEQLVIEAISQLEWFEELEQFKKALEQAKSAVLTTKAFTLENVGAHEAAIFDAHLMMLEDPEWLAQIESEIKSGKTSAFSVKKVSGGFIEIFSSLEDAYLKERALDLKDVSERLIRILMGVEETAIEGDGIILLAEDLTPSDTAQIDKSKVLGFITEIGGTTSHSAIMARTIGLPAIVGTGQGIHSLKEDMLIAMDGETGEVFVEPTDAVLLRLREKSEAIALESQRLLLLKGHLTHSLDGRRIEIACNIGGVKDLEHVIANDGEGIGLFRSEFLYMDRTDMPSESEQYEAYKSVLEAMGQKPVVIRTLDIGGDKQLPYLNIPKEENPFLGLRAIRYCLKHEQVFITQIRALLRAGLYGNLRIMMPMISGLTEIRAAKQLIEKAKGELEKEGLPYTKQYQLGIMIEIPSAAIMADQLAKEVDFFSIGTNDLIQYTVAVDRMNQDIASLYEPFNPAVLRLIYHVIQSGKRAGIWVGMCGETAGNPNLIPVYLGMGLEEFSMNPSKVLKAREQISRLSQAKLEQEIQTLLNLPDEVAVKAFVDKHFM